MDRRRARLAGARDADDVKSESVAGVELVADRPQLDVVPALLTDGRRVTDVVGALRLNDVAGGVDE